MDHSQRARLTRGSRLPASPEGPCPRRWRPYESLDDYRAGADHFSIRARAFLFTLRCATERRRSPLSDWSRIARATAGLRVCLRIIFLKGLVLRAEGLRRTLLRLRLSMFRPVGEWRF